MRSFMGRDILSLKDFERNEFFHVLEVAEEMEPIARQRRNVDLLKEKTMVTAFYQPSTRTRLAHEAAMHRLGGHVTGFADAKMTRAGDFYQESIKDTVKMLEFYGDVIVMRHFQQGAPHEAAKWASIPVINGGDGWGEHPTQILTDLYTIYRERGHLDGLRWLAVGDMRMLTQQRAGAPAGDGAHVANGTYDIASIKNRFGLSKREGEVIELLLQGKRYDDIGNALFISKATVKTHVFRIYQKAGVRSRIQLVNRVLSPE